MGKPLLGKVRAFCIAPGALICLGIGLRGLITRRPFLISSCWHFGIWISFCSPWIVGWIDRFDALDWPFGRNYNGLFPSFLIIFHFLAAVINFCFWTAAVYGWGSVLVEPLPQRTYRAHGVTDLRAMRDALDATLQGMNLPFEQSARPPSSSDPDDIGGPGLNPSSDPRSVTVPSLGIEIDVTVQSWSRAAKLSISGPGHQAELRSIVQGMNDYFRRTKADANLLTCMASIVFVLMFVLWLWYWVWLGS